MALAPATVPNSGSRASSLPSPGEQELSVPTTRGPRPPPGRERLSRSGRPLAWPTHPPPRLPHPDLPASGARDRCPTGPLAPDQPTSLSPHAAEILTQRSLTFSLGASLSYPLSIDPPRTWRGLAFCASFGLLLIGTARALSRESAFGLSGAFAVLGAALAVVGIVQKATFNGKIYGFWELVQGGARLFATGGRRGTAPGRPDRLGHPCLVLGSSSTPHSSPSFLNSPSTTAVACDRNALPLWLDFLWRCASSVDRSVLSGRVRSRQTGWLPSSHRSDLFCVAAVAGVRAGTGLTKPFAS